MSSSPSRNSKSKMNCFFKYDEERCSHEYFTFRDIQSKYFEKEWFPKATSLLSVSFLKADLFYPPKVNLSSSYICSSHFTALSKPHKLNTSKKCIACECFGKRSTKTAAYTNVNNTQALVLYEKFGICKSYGELICTSCRVNNLPAHVDRP